MPKFTVVKQAVLETLPLTPGGQRAGADRGDPQIACHPLTPEASGSLGVWECEPGGWPVVERKDTEFTYILSGKARLTDESSGQVIEISSGDLVILPPGWTGRWDILEPLRKVYAIF